jgi:cytoskeleton protein RodZ
MSDGDGQATEEERLDGETLSVGQRLKAARETSDISIDHISADLRVERRYVTALEADNFDEFSAPVFTKGYLKQYALRLGLNEGDLLQHFDRQVGEQQDPQLRSDTLAFKSDRQQSRWPVAVSGLVLIVTGGVVWWLNQPGPVVVRAVPETGVESPQVAPAEIPAVAPPGLTETLAAPVQEVAEEPIVPPLEVPAELPAPSLEVEIVFAENCWTEVIDASGERLFYGLGSAGAQTRFTATPPLSFFLGNASGVELRVDGAPFAIPGENRQGNLARFVILAPGD